MSGEMNILLWWSLFGGTHILGSATPVRGALIQKLGLSGFKGLYSVVSFATFIPLCWTFGVNKHAGALVFAEAAWMHWAAYALMLGCLIFWLQGVTTPNPMSTPVEMSGKYPSRARGIQRITRHPVNTTFALFGLAHCLVNSNVGDLIFFGGFPVFALLSATHQDHRARNSGKPEVVEFHRQTSMLPFLAILQGRQALELSEFKRVPLAVSVLLWIGLPFVHGMVFGGAL